MQLMKDLYQAPHLVSNRRCALRKVNNPYKVVNSLMSVKETSS